MLTFAEEAEHDLLELQREMPACRANGSFVQLVREAAT